MDYLREPQATGMDYYQKFYKDRRYGLYRIELPFDAADNAEVMLQPRMLSEISLIFPSISPRMFGRKHCFVWAAEGETFLGKAVKLVKLNLCHTAGIVSTDWTLPGFVLVAQASFVPASSDHSDPEDAGWLMVPLQQLHKGGRGALAVLNASDMTTASLTLLEEGDVLNWGAHSTFVSARATGGQSGTRISEETKIQTTEDAIKKCVQRLGGDNKEL